MAKGNNRQGNREAKKPKKDRPKGTIDPNQPASSPFSVKPPGKK